MIQQQQQRRSTALSSHPSNRPSNISSVPYRQPAFQPAAVDTIESREPSIATASSLNTPNTPSFNLTSASAPRSNGIVDGESPPVGRLRKDPKARQRYTTHGPVQAPPEVLDAPKAPPVSYRQFSQISPQVFAVTAYDAPEGGATTNTRDTPISPSASIGRASDASGHKRRFSDPIVATEPSSGKSDTLDPAVASQNNPETHQGLAIKTVSGHSGSPRVRVLDWAHDRSPLQKLELTLRDISKEEEKADREEAELLARQGLVGREGRRRSSVGVPPPVPASPEPTSLADVGLARSLSQKQKEKLQRSTTVDSRRMPGDSSPNVSDDDRDPRRRRFSKTRADVQALRRLVSASSRDTPASIRDRELVTANDGSGVQRMPVRGFHLPQNNQVRATNGIVQDDSPRTPPVPPLAPETIRKYSPKNGTESKEFIPPAIPVPGGSPLIPSGSPLRQSHQPLSPTAPLEPLVPAASREVTIPSPTYSFDQEIPESKLQRTSQLNRFSALIRGRRGKSPGPPQPISPALEQEETEAPKANGHAKTGGVLGILRNKSVKRERSPSPIRDALEDEMPRKSSDRKRQSIGEALFSRNKDRDRSPPPIPIDDEPRGRQMESNHRRSVSGRKGVFSMLIPRGRTPSPSNYSERSFSPGPSPYPPTKPTLGQMLFGQAAGTGLARALSGKKRSQSVGRGMSSSRRQSTARDRSWSPSPDRTRASTYAADLPAMPSRRSTFAGASETRRPRSRSLSPERPRTSHGAQEVESRAVRDTVMSSASSRRDPEFSPDGPQFTRGTMRGHHRRVASLNASDLTLEDKPTPWWEKSNSGKRRGSNRSRTASISSEVHALDSSFNPPLYLKCGPILRYVGLRCEKAAQEDEEGNSTEADMLIWRGSVMIATEDNKSTYEQPPSLRLFSQPIDLLPEPPRELEHDGRLRPEYVDPVAGQPKVTRTGKTVYVRPVEQLRVGRDLSRMDIDKGLFEAKKSPMEDNFADETASQEIRRKRENGEEQGRYGEVQGFKLLSEYGVTFWRFNLEVELTDQQARVAYRINEGPAIGFWVPGATESMHVMFHNGNGFDVEVDSDPFSGPDPLWRDVLNTHQTRPFHAMLGGGNQIYNDDVNDETRLFRDWVDIQDNEIKSSVAFNSRMREEVERHYLEKYCTWFSQGLFGLANSQIPMVNVWNDRDIVEGYGAFRHEFMDSPVFKGLGDVAYKYYMLFQHQSMIDEDETDETSWILSRRPGPYLPQKSRHLFMLLGRKTALLALDCRTERTKNLVISDKTYDSILDRCYKEIIKGQTKHLVVVCPSPLTFPKLHEPPTPRRQSTFRFSKAKMPQEADLSHVDDLGERWVAPSLDEERIWLIEELQMLAAEKSVRVTILSGEVGANSMGRLHSVPSLGVPKDHDHRYMLNIISSGIANSPIPDGLADAIARRAKTVSMNKYTEETMIPLFDADVDGRVRENETILPRRAWCSIREYEPGHTPPDTPSVESLKQQYDSSDPSRRPQPQRKSLAQSLAKNPPDPRFSVGGLFNRESRQKPDISAARDLQSPDSTDYHSAIRPKLRGGAIGRDSFFSRSARPETPYTPSEMSLDDEPALDLTGALEVVFNVENTEGEPDGITVPYQVLIPTLTYLQSYAAPKTPKESVMRGRDSESFEMKRASTFAAPSRRGTGGSLMRMLERSSTFGAPSQQNTENTLGSRLSRTLSGGGGGVRRASTTRESRAYDDYPSNNPGERRSVLRSFTDALAGRSSTRYEHDNYSYDSVDSYERDRVNRDRQRIMESEKRKIRLQPRSD